MWKVIDKIGLFLQNIFTALKFAAFDYDVTLRRTKTDRQRLIIWSTIFTITIIVCYLFLIFLSHSIRTVINSQSYFHSK